MTSLRLFSAAVLLFAFAFVSAAAAQNQPSPADTPLMTDGITNITCVCAETGSAFKPGLYHYDVYLPPGYDTEKERTYPCLFVMSPGGKPHELFNMVSDRARRDRWIVVLLLEAKNGPWEPIVSNFVAAHDDVVQRCRVQQGLKFATGTSGGALASRMFVTARPGFGGLIMCAQSFLSSSKIAQQRQLGVYFAFGRECYNADALPGMLQTLTRSRMAHNWEVPLAGHKAHSPEFYDRALEWQENRIYFDMPGLPEPLAMYKFNDKYETLSSAADDLEKHDQLRFLTTLADQHKLTGDAEVKEKTMQMKEELATLMQDEQLKKELAARADYAKAFRNEQNVWLHYIKLGKKRELLDQAIAAANAAYKTVADSHPATKYGTQAAVRMSLVSESKSIEPSKPKGKKK